MNSNKYGGISIGAPNSLARRSQAIAILKDKLSNVKPESDEDEGAFEYMGDIQACITALENGADIEETMSNV